MNVDAATQPLYLLIISLTSNGEYSNYMSDNVPTFSDVLNFIYFKKITLY